MKHLRRFGANESGAALVLAAILFPVVIGGMGLGAETGYWYLSQRMLQHAADVSAHAAGSRQRAGDTDDKIEAAAVHVATESGYVPGSPNQVAVDPHYTSTDHPGAKLVEVVVTHVQPRLLSSLFSSEPVTITGRAVAKVEPTGSVACVLALSANAAGAATVSGSSTVDLSGCDVASNSNASNSLYVGSALRTGCAYAVGEAETPTAPTLTNCDAVKEFAPKVRDPYADVMPPPHPGSCKSRHQGHPTQPSPSLKPGCYNGLTVKGELHFEPGVYYINGGEFNVNSGDNAKLTGSGVTFYLANGAKLNIGGSIQMNFSAPTDPANPYAGILFFADRASTGVNHVLAGNSASDYTGAMYAPTSKVSFTGNSKSGIGGCTQIIGDTVTFTGNSSLKSDCSNAGTSDIVTNETVKIVE